MGSHREKGKEMKKLQFDDMYHVSSRGFHIKPGQTVYAFEHRVLPCYILCHTKSRSSSFATEPKTLVDRCCHAVAI